MFKSFTKTLIPFIRYNYKVIFAGKFVWFLLGALAMFILVAITTVMDNEVIEQSMVYDILLFPSIIIIFYPTVYGVQSDSDAKILEIIFGIPNYRYKIWLVRLIATFAVVYLITYLFALAGNYLVINISAIEMTNQLMFFIVFMGSLAFWLSTTIKNGNGTAVAMIFVGVIYMILGESGIENTMWDIYLNPFYISTDMNEMIWAGVVSDNRLILSISSIVFILWGLFNLQDREGFARS